MENWYQEDLAYIHDVGFSAWAVKSAPGILAILQQNQIREGLVVDLGCGSGLLTQAIAQAGYQAIGIDISEAMLAIARLKVPTAEFRCDSLFSAEIPPCHAVTCIGECINYLADSSDLPALRQLFARVYNALSPGGVFIFDIAEPRQLVPGTISQSFHQGEDWLVLVEKQEDRETHILTRKIISFRKVGELYRRAEETHRLNLYKAANIARELHRAGFRVRTARRYGQYYLPKAHAVLIACKPATN